jgi:outer membrane protein assembly factor BamB
VSRRALLTGFAAALGLAAAGGVLTTRSTPTTPTTPAPAPPPVVPGTATRLWTGTGPARATAIVADASAVYVGGNATVAGGNATVVALDTATGQQRWVLDEPTGGGEQDRFGVHLAVADSTVYVATRLAAIAVDVATGQQRWRVPLHLADPYAVSVVAAGPDAVYLTHDRLLVALDAATGAERWVHTVAGEFAGSPTPDGDRVLVNNGTGGEALDVATGQPVWQRPPGRANFAAMTVADGTVFQSITKIGVAALDATTGAARWETSLDVGLGGHRPVVVDGTVVVLADQRLHALDAATGAPRWVAPNLGYDYPGGIFANTAPGVSGGLVHSGNTYGLVYALAASTGEAIWAHVSQTTVNPSVFRNVLAVVDGVVFVASFNGQVAAIRPE